MSRHCLLVANVLKMLSSLKDPTKEDLSAKEPTETTPKVCMLLCFKKLSYFV